MSPKSTSTKRIHSSNSQSLKAQSTLSFKRTKSGHLSPFPARQGGKDHPSQGNKSASEIDEYSATERKDTFFKRPKNGCFLSLSGRQGGKDHPSQRNNSASEIDECSDTERKDADSIEISSDEESSPGKGKGQTPLKQSNVEIDLHANNPRKWSRHYAQVREKMGGLQPSMHIRRCPLFIS